MFRLLLENLLGEVVEDVALFPAEAIESDLGLLRFSS